MEHVLAAFLFDIGCKFAKISSHVFDSDGGFGNAELGFNNERDFESVGFFCGDCGFDDLFGSEFNFRDLDLLRSGREVWFLGDKDRSCDGCILGRV